MYNFENNFYTTIIAINNEVVLTTRNNEIFVYEHDFAKGRTVRAKSRS